MPSPPFAVEGLIHLGEHVENFGKHLGGDPRAIVLHAYNGLRCLESRCKEDLPTFLRVFGRVIEQVAHNLGESGEITIESNVLVDVLHDQFVI